jgi:Thoeris protein ThsB, TIR-like domain
MCFTASTTCPIVRVFSNTQHGVVDGNKPAHDSDWEKLAMAGEKAVQAWIDNQLIGRSGTIVAIGEATARRKWIDYEIKSRGMTERVCSASTSITSSTSSSRQYSKGQTLL